jgi:hypothetical protein
VLALLRLRDPSLSEPHQFWRSKELFGSMPISTARKTVEFVKKRQATLSVLAETPKLRLINRK